MRSIKFNVLPQSRAFTQNVPSGRPVRLRAWIQPCNKASRRYQCLCHRVRTFSALIEVVGGWILRQALTRRPLVPGTDGVIEATFDGGVTFVTKLLVAHLHGFCGHKEHCVPKRFARNFALFLGRIWSSHDAEDEDRCLLGGSTVYYGRCVLVFHR